MSQYSGWEINVVGSSLKTYTNEEELIVINGNEICTSLSKLKGQPELIELKAGDMRFVISHENKVINIFYK